MKYKIGDKVRITREIHNHRFNIGDIVKIIEVNEYGTEYGTLPYLGSKGDEFIDWWFSEDECEPITKDSYDIHITSNGVYTNCLYKKNGEIVSSSSAKLNQDSSDVFDIKEGARLCIERLSSDKVKRVVCVKSKNIAKDIWTLGKIYEFKDGRMLRDDKIWSSKYKSLEEMNERLKNVKFVELEEIKIMFKCSMCDMEFANVDEYVAHVSKCAEQYKVKESKKKEEELKKAREVNSYIESIKSYEKIVNDCKKEFKEKYPNEYEMNFKEKTCSCKEEPRKESFYGSVNGKECDNMDEFIEKLERECGEWLW